MTASQVYAEAYNEFLAGGLRMNVKGSDGQVREIRVKRIKAKPAKLIKPAIQVLAEVGGRTLAEHRAEIERLTALYDEPTPAKYTAPEFKGARRTPKASPHLMELIGYMSE